MFGDRGMFDHMVPEMKPSPAEMEAAAQEALFQKGVNLADYKVRVFNMGDPKDVKAYEELMKVMVIGIQAKTHVLWANDRVFVPGDDPRWMRYLEWSVFELEIKPVQPISSAGV